MPRAITDQELKVTATLPNAANTVNSNAIDLGATTPYPTTEKITVRISHTAATSANTLNMNIRLQESDVNTSANFTNVAVLANPVLRTLGVGSAYAAANIEIALPPTVKRYIRAVALGQANGGDASDGTFSVEVLT